MWQTCLKCHLDLNLINFSAGAAELKWKKILLNTKYYNSYTKSKEAVSYDRINVTKNWLEYDPKFLTKRNLNGLTWPKFCVFFIFFQNNAISQTLQIKLLLAFGLKIICAFH